MNLDTNLDVKSEFGRVKIFSIFLGLVNILTVANTLNPNVAIFD